MKQFFQTFRMKFSICVTLLEYIPDHGRNSSTKSEVLKPSTNIFFLYNFFMTLTIGKVHERFFHESIQSY